MNLRQFSTCILTLAAGLFISSCSREKPYPVYFLNEAEGTEQGAKFSVRYKGRYYERLPMLNLENFGRFASSLAPDGSYGIVFEAKKEFYNRVYIVTQRNIGKRLLPVMAGLAFEPQYINAPITDGKLYIRNGLNGYDLYMIAKTVKPVNEKLEEARFLKEDPRADRAKRAKRTDQKDVGGRYFVELQNAQ